MMNRLLSSVWKATSVNRVGVVTSGPSRCFASRSSTPANEDTRITLTDDGTTIVCWHPRSQKDIRYEDTLPYVAEHPHADSVFKHENVLKGENIYYKGKTTIKSMEEVQALTFTVPRTWARNRYTGLQMRPAHPRKGV